MTQNNSQIPLIDIASKVGLEDEVAAAKRVWVPDVEDRKRPTETLPEPPWDRMRYERPDAHHAFIRYRDLGVTRTLKGFAQAAPEEMRAVVRGASKVVMMTVGQYQTQVYRWSSRFRWYDRAVAWDDHCIAEWNESRKRSLFKAYDDNAKMATNFLEKLSERIENLDLEKIPLHVLHQYARTFADIQMLSLGHKERKPEDEIENTKAPTLVQVNFSADTQGTVEETVTPDMMEPDLEGAP